jgi:serine/threonine protein kinase
MPTPEAEQYTFEPRDVRVGDHIGRYVLTTELGRGGMGRVFVAHDASLDRLVAIKFISTLGADVVERFLAEARVTARCTHPNIVTVHEIGQHDGAPYLVLEHLFGQTLAQLVHDGERMSFARVVTIMTGVAQALACAHSHRIVHRDLKPSNIVVLPDDTAKVLDFGIATYAHNGIASEDGGVGHQPGELAGTLPYMAPEQFRGVPVDGRVDIWAFGVALHQLLVGVRPFDHLDEAAMQAELLDLERPTPSISRHRSDLPPALVEIVQRCLAKSPAQRYRSTNELVVAMQQLAVDRTSATSVSRGRSRMISLVIVLAATGIAGDGPRPASRSVAPDLLLQLDRLEDEMARSQASGDAVAANTLFESFVARPENARARATAWLRRSSRQIAASELEPALASASAAYLAAVDESEEVRGLTAVLSAQLARRHWDEAGRALAALGPVESPTIARAAATIAVATRRQPPRRADTSPVVAAAGRLLVGRPEPAPAVHAEAIDLDGDGRDEVLAVDNRGLRALSPGNVLWQIPWPSSSPGLDFTGRVRVTCAARDAGGAWFAVTQQTTQLFRVGAHGATLVLETAPALACALGDLDGNGTAELYLADRRDLVRHHADAGGTWHSTRLALGSEVSAMVAADLDGDGDVELAIAVAEWQAFDVRILVGADLALVDRVKLGRVVGLTALSRGPGRPSVLLARKQQPEWSSRWYLPPQHRKGAPDGLYAMRLEAGRLRVVGSLGRTSKFGEWGPIHAADLDGDGHDEAILNDIGDSGRRWGASIVRIDNADHLDATVIEGVSVLGAGRFREGHDAVLAILRDDPSQPRWWLGVGATPVPPLASATHLTDMVVPRGIDGPLAASWRRAVTLGRVGDVESALAAWEHLTAVVPRELQAAATAELLALQTHHDKPRGNSYARLAERTPIGSPRHLAVVDEAVTAAVHDGDVAAAVRMLDAALGSSLAFADRARFSEMRTRIAPVAVTLFGGERLDSTWDVVDPIGVHRDPVTHALILDSFGSKHMAAIELERTRGPIELTVEGTITRAEWGAAIRFSLQPVAMERQRLSFGIRTMGGGGDYVLVAERPTLDEPAPPMAQWPHRGVDTPVAIRVHATWFPDTERMIWQLTVDGVTVRRVYRMPAVNAARWRFEIASKYSYAGPNASRSALAVTRIVVSGVQPVYAQRDRLAMARLSLANGDHGRARSLLGAVDDRETRMISAVLALRERRMMAAMAALARLRRHGRIADSEIEDWAHLARVGDGMSADAVRDTLGADRTKVITAAWNAVANQHPDAELVQRELTQNLRELELPLTGDPPLRLLRARAHAAIGEIGAAETDLDTLLDPAMQVDASMRAEAYFERARIALQRRDDAQAQRAILDALDASPWPEAIADRVMLDAALSSLATRPGLERVHALGRTLAWLADRP